MARLIAAALRTSAWMVVLVLILVAVVATMRWTAIGDMEREALARVDVAPATPAGRNGFASLMLSGHEVPPDRLDAVLAEDVSAFAAWLAASDGKQPFWPEGGAAPPATEAPYAPLSGSAFPERAALPAADDVCGLSAPGCLAMVRDHEARIAQVLHEQAGRLANLDQALAADHVVNPYPPTVGTPLPPFGGLRLPLTAAALDAVQGRAPQAYARTCGLLASARRMDRQGRNLVEKLIAQSLAEGSAWLLLDLRRGFPVATLPASCADALVPVDTDEAGVCEAMRGEYRMQRALIAQLDAQLGGWRPQALLTRALLFDAELQAAWSAREFSPYCGDATRDLADAGLPPPPPPPESVIGFRSPACYAAYINCVLAQIAGPSFAPYADRALDHAAKLRLLLAAQAVADGRRAPANAASEASVAGYPVDFDPATQQATITLRAPRDGETAFRVDFHGLAPMPRLTSLEGLAR